MGYGRVNSTGTRFNWYAARLDNLSLFQVALPAAGCAAKATTTSTANLHNCQAAFNLGYFDNTSIDPPSYCLGEIVVNSSVVLWQGDGAPLLAVTSRNTTLIGNLSRTDVDSRSVTYGVAGFGVIVRDSVVDAVGVSRAQAAIRALRPKAEEIAPRTVAGLDAAGRLFFVAIDGVEQLNLGLTMSELAEIFSVGAEGFPHALVHAINFDGGGSTTMSVSPLWPLPAQIFNRPTDTDYGPISERAVTSIACIRPA